MQEIPIVLIGHQDHGKSTLIGRLILDSGSIKESRVREIKEIDKASGQKFELAHLVDSFREEREREMTMDTTRAILKGKERNYQLIDVPGHAELIANMLTGAAGAEAALLMVSIEEGIKEQTRQHLEIAKLLGIEQLGVVVNKMDKVDYREEAFNEVKGKLKIILTDIGYLAEDIYFFPISAWEGENVVKKSERTPWHKGMTVMEFVENKIKLPESFESLPLVFLVQDRYPEEGKDILIGLVEAGRITSGEELLFLPSNEKAKVESVKDSEEELREAEAGQNIGIILSEDLNLERGSVGVSSNSNLKIAKEISGEIFWITKPSQKKLVLECGTTQTEGELQEPEVVKDGEKTFYKIITQEPIVFESKGRTILGKIVLKDQGKIIGVGNIL
jgi:bifunctional enzyme CysN/CysC/sulfate adenylyltransferase subunit 1